MTWETKFLSAVSPGIHCQRCEWGGEGEWAAAINAALMPSIKIPGTDQQLSGGGEQCALGDKSEKSFSISSIFIWRFHLEVKYSVVMREGGRGGRGGGGRRGGLRGAT